MPFILFIPLNALDLIVLTFGPKTIVVPLYLSLPDITPVPITSTPLPELNDVHHPPPRLPNE